MGNPEHVEQSLYIGYCKAAVNYAPALATVFAIPNFRRQTLQTAAYMYREGLRPGMPDTCLPIARRSYHALYIEFKADSNKPALEQELWLSILTLLGNCCCVFYSGEEAFQFAREYEAGEVQRPDIYSWTTHKGAKIDKHYVVKSIQELVEELDHATAERRSRKRRPSKER